MSKIFCIFSILLLGISLGACDSKEKRQPQTDSAAVSEPVKTKNREQPEIITLDENIDIDTPLAEGPAGTLSYFEPWGNVAVYSGECGEASGVYELGEAVSGTEYIEGLAGKIQIEAAGTTVYEKVINVQVGDKNFTATLESNTAVDEFVQIMQEAPIVIDMSDYSGFEKVGSLGTNLTASNSQTATQSGDIVLYNGNQIVIFYGSHSWSYTRLAKIDDLSGWTEALGSGNVQVTFSVIE